MAIRHPLPYTFAKANTLLLEDDGEQLVLWAAEDSPVTALTEVLRQYAIGTLEREPGATLGTRIAAAYAGGESNAATVVGDIGTLVGADRISFTSEADRQIVRGDRGQIEQLIRNLADNALKYSDDAVPVQVKLDGRSGASILTISDTGPGIPAEHLPHITRRFYRTDPGRSRAAGGTGLGLAIVKHIVERHRAELDIASVEGKGTRVSIAFPPQAPVLS